MNRSLTISFGGGAWYALFYLGAAQYIHEHAKTDGKKHMKYAGISAGSSAASALALGIEPRIIAEELISVQPMCTNVRRTFKMVHGVALDTVPRDDDVCRLTSDRLLIGLSEYMSIIHFKEHKKTTFMDRNDLLRALQATCNIPILNGIEPVYVCGRPFYDGNICYNWKNLPTFSNNESERTLYITSKTNEYLKEFRQGWISPRIDIPKSWQLCPPGPDALRFLMRLGYLRTWEYLSVYDNELFNSTTEDTHELQDELDTITNQKHLVYS